MTEDSTLPAYDPEAWLEKCVRDAEAKLTEQIRKELGREDIIAKFDSERVPRDLPTARHAIVGAMRVIVCGSRRWRDRAKIANRLFDLPTDSVIVHGNAQGADRIAHQEAQKLGLLVEPHPADWGALGRRAGMVRNVVMANLGADLLIAFWDGRSTGTAHMIDQATIREIPVEVIRP